MGKEKLIVGLVMIGFEVLFVFGYILATMVEWNSEIVSRIISLSMIVLFNIVALGLFFSGLKD